MMHVRVHFSSRDLLFINFFSLSSYDTAFTLLLWSVEELTWLPLIRVLEQPAVTTFLARVIIHILLTKLTWVITKYCPLVTILWVCTFGAIINNSYTVWPPVSEMSPCPLMWWFCPQDVSKRKQDLHGGSLSLKVKSCSEWVISQLLWLTVQRHPLALQKNNDPNHLHFCVLLTYTLMILQNDKYVWYCKPFMTIYGTKDNRA